MIPGNAVAVGWPGLWEDSLVGPRSSAPSPASQLLWEGFKIKRIQYLVLSAARTTPPMTPLGNSGMPGVPCLAWPTLTRSFSFVLQFKESVLSFQGGWRSSCRIVVLSLLSPSYWFLPLAFVTSCCTTGHILDTQQFLSVSDGGSWWLNRLTCLSQAWPFKAFVRVERKVIAELKGSCLYLCKGDTQSVQPWVQMTLHEVHPFPGFSATYHVAFWSGWRDLYVFFQTNHGENSCG